MCGWRYIVRAVALRNEVGIDIDKSPATMGGELNEKRRARRPLTRDAIEREGVIGILFEERGF